MKKTRKTISIFLLLCIFSGTLTLFTGCSEKDPFKNGVKVEANIKPDQDVNVGNLQETGWQLAIPANTVASDSKLTMRVLSETDSKAYQSTNFTLYGSPVEITLEDRENVRLGDAVSLTLQIPKEVLKDMVAEELFFAVYYDGNWEYFMPNNINLEKGTASLEVHHFSFFGFGKPSEEKQIKTFAKNFAALQWEGEHHTKKLTDSLSRQYDDLFASMGVNNSSLRTQLTLDVINYLENEKLDTGDMSPISTLANMANAASQGKEGMDDFRNQLIEFTGKALYRTLEKDPGKFSSLANVTGGLSTAAGAISAGDTEGALQGIASILKAANPITAVVTTALTAVKEGMEASIELWTQSEIEKAYQIYIGKAEGKYGYKSGLEGDFESIFTTLGGGERMMKINLVKKYCAKYGMKESNLSQEERDRIVRNAMTSLKRNFEDRKVSDPEIAKLQQKEEAFIAELKKQNLLVDSNYRSYFGIDKNLSNFNIGDRLERLYRLKATVLGVMDKDQAAKISEEYLAKAIDQWIYWNEKGDRAGFFRYMREMGYIKEPYEINASYAWVLVETVDENNAEGWAKANEHSSYKYDYSYSSSSYSASTTFIGVDQYDSGVKGSLGLEATFTGVPQVIQPDTPVSLKLFFTTTQNDAVKLSFSGSAGADFCRYDGSEGKTAGPLISYFANEDGKDGFNIDVNGNPSSYNETLKATIGGGSEDSRIVLRTRFTLSGVPMRTYYVYEWKPAV